MSAGGSLTTRVAWPVLAFPALAALASTAVAGGDPGFRQVTADESGVDFVHQNGATGEKQYYEAIGSGAALLDYDGDGRLDLYLVTSVGANRMYRNEGGWKFRDVTDACGAGDTGYGMGASAADVDGDGDTDLFVTNFGPNAFYRNRGDGTFEEVAGELGLDDARFGAGVAFLDYDRDGRLDLYVANYVQMAVPDTNYCEAEGGQRVYCAPRAYPPEADLLYRQEADGRFRDVSRESGILDVIGRGLGVVTLDVDFDGWTDLYLANDDDPNFLFRNTGQGTFVEIGIPSGVSHSEAGLEESGMGVAVGDYDGDGLPDLFVSNYSNEMNTVYRNEGDGFFLDESARTGLGPPSLPYIGWGAGFLDYDRDGWLDLLFVNGHTEMDAELVDKTTSWKQPDFLLRNRGDGTFEDVTAAVAPALLVPRAGRGVAFGDLDDDGDQDVVIVNQNEEALLLECTGRNDASGWIGLEPRDGGSNPDAIGTGVELWSGGRRRRAEVRAGDSYLSCSDRRLLFTLPAGAAPDSVEVRWPGGERQRITGLAPGRYHVIERDRAR